MDYNKAYNKLEELIEELENGEVKLEKLTSKVKEANELILVCEQKLKGVEGEIEGLEKE